MNTIPETGICSLCGGPFDHFGNNPEPIKKYPERCCDTCNNEKVLPARGFPPFPAEVLEQMKNPAAERLKANEQAAASVMEQQPVQQPKPNPLPLPVPTVPLDSKPKRKRSLSRSARWGEAAGKALAALEAIVNATDDLEEAASELHSVQEEYSEWKDNLPENFASSPLGEKLEEVCNLEIEDAAQKIRDAVEEVQSTFEDAEGIDLPKGFGRD